MASRTRYPSADAPDSGEARGRGRVLWKGAISFGLVHIPVGLHTATTDQGIDFDWLDRRTMDPVGYKRINKRTGKDIDRAHIVKGVQYEDGQYVIVSPEEIAGAFVRATQTIEIERFVDASDIPFLYLERPYYLAPINKGHKVYALLRTALEQTGKVALARVVIQTRQHLALLAPSGPALVLNLLRWGDEVKPSGELDLPTDAQALVKPSELRMAMQLIDEMTGHWDPQEFRDEFREQVMALVARKAREGEIHAVRQPAAAPSGSAEIIDLTELLQRSLKTGGAPRGKAGSLPATTPSVRAPATPARKTTATGRTIKPVPTPPRGKRTA